MAIERQKVMVGQLSLGMYVAELDRSWLETPFKLQGFLLKNQEQLIELSSLCQFVYIDIEKGVNSPEQRKLVQSIISQNTGNSKAHAVPPAIYTFSRYQKRTNTYSRQSDFYQSTKKVQAAQHEAREVLRSVNESLGRGEVFDQAPVKKAALDIVDCVINNPDVMSWLGRIDEFDNFTHDHSVRSATWASICARFLGFDRKDMSVLVQAVLLKDVGKTRLPKHLLEVAESDINVAELALYQKYVSLSVALLKQVKGLDPKVLEIIQAHREKYDGSGFPKGLSGEEIPALSIISHMATEYDLLVNSRDASLQISPSEAMRALHLMKNKVFQEDIVVDFGQALGAYPAGSIVELNTGAMAVVLEQNEQRKLRPIISVVTDERLMPLKKVKKIDLLTQARAPLHEESGSEDTKLPELYIVRDLSAEQCSVDLLALKRSLFNGKRSVFSLLTGG